MRAYQNFCDSSGFDPATQGIYRKTKAPSTLGSDTLAKDQRVYLDLAAINQDSDKFASPEDVVPTRPATAYTLLQGDGVFKILGEEFVYGTAATVLQAVFSLKNVRRAAGKTGTLRRQAKALFFRRCHFFPVSYRHVHP